MNKIFSRIYRSQDHALPGLAGPEYRFHPLKKPQGNKPLDIGVASAPIDGFVRLGQRQPVGFMGHPGGKLRADRVEKKTGKDQLAKGRMIRPGQHGFFK